MAGLEILDARYGAVGSDKDKKDVTSNVRAKISSDKQSVSFTVSFTNLAITDPAVGNPKEMKVRYAINGAERSETILDGNTFAVQVPQEPPKTLSGLTALLYLAIWQNMLSAVSLFIMVFGGSVAYSLGWYFGNGIVWGIVSILFPYASFWLIPVFVILARAFSPVNFIQ
jgi:hypothetical protein